MGLPDPVGTMSRRLRELGVTDEGGLRLIIAALLEPSTQMVDEGWSAHERWSQAFGLTAPPAIVLKSMLKAVLVDMVEDDKQRQHADTDGLAKQHDVLHGYLRRAGIEREEW